MFKIHGLALTFTTELTFLTLSYTHIKEKQPLHKVPPSSISAELLIQTLVQSGILFQQFQDLKKSAINDFMYLQNIGSLLYYNILYFIGCLLALLV